MREEQVQGKKDDGNRAGREWCGLPVMGYSAATAKDGKEEEGRETKQKMEETRKQTEEEGVETLEESWKKYHRRNQEIAEMKEKMRIEENRKL